MLEIIIVAGLSWIVGDWLISKKQTAGFVVASFFAVLFFGLLSGFIFGGILASMAGEPNSFGAAVIGAIRGALFGLIFGGWSIVKSYRAIRKANAVKAKGDSK